MKRVLLFTIIISSAATVMGQKILEQKVLGTTEKEKWETLGNVEDYGENGFVVQLWQDFFYVDNDLEIITDQSLVTSIKKSGTLVRNELQPVESYNGAEPYSHSLHTGLYGDLKKIEFSKLDGKEQIVLTGKTKDLDNFVPPLFSGPDGLSYFAMDYERYSKDAPKYSLNKLDKNATITSTSIELPHTADEIDAIADLSSPRSSSFVWNLLNVTNAGYTFIKLIDEDIDDEMLLQTRIYSKGNVSTAFEYKLQLEIPAGYSLSMSYTYPTTDNKGFYIFGEAFRKTNDAYKIIGYYYAEFEIGKNTPLYTGIINIDQLTTNSGISLKQLNSKGKIMGFSTFTIDFSPRGTISFLHQYNLKQAINPYNSVDIKSGELLRITIDKKANEVIRIEHLKASGDLDPKYRMVEAHPEEYDILLTTKKSEQMAMLSPARAYIQKNHLKFKDVNWAVLERDEYDILIRYDIKTSKVTALKIGY